MNLDLKHIFYSARRQFEAAGIFGPVDLEHEIQAELLAYPDIIHDTRWQMRIIERFKHRGQKRIKKCFILPVSRLSEPERDVFMNVVYAIGGKYAIRHKGRTLDGYDGS